MAVINHADAPASSLAGPADHPGGRGWQREILLALGLLGLSALALFLAYQPAATYTVDISEARSTAELEGVYLPESNDQFGPYRWTPGQITIHLRPIGGPLHVRVRLAGWRPLRPSSSAGSPLVVFTLDGRELARAQTSNSAQDIDLTIPRGQALFSSLDLQLQTPTFKFGNDPRDLGVVLMGVEASSGAEWPKPALPNGVVVWQTLLGVLLLFGAGRAAGWKVSGAYFTASAAVLTLAIMFAMDRQRYAQWTWIWLVFALLALGVGSYWRQLSRFASQCAWAIRHGTLPGENYELRITNYDEQGQSTIRLPSQAQDPSSSFVLRSGSGPSEPAIGTPPRFLPALLVLAALAITLLHPLAALLPRDILDTTSYSTDYTNFSWGLLYYSSLPFWLAWGGIALLFVFAIPRVNRKVLARLSPIRRYFTGSNPYGWLVVAGLGATLFLWLLRTSASQGDSSELLTKLANGDLWHEREPLDYYIHFKLFQTFAGLGVTPLDVYQWLSVVAGGLLVVGIVLAACLLAPPGRRWLVAGMGLATGNLLLFAGYVESYTLDTLGLVWFLVASLLYLRGSAPAAIPAFVLAVTMWLHPQTAFLLPALLAALLLKQESWAARLKEAGVMLATALSVSLVVATIFLVEGYSWQRWEIARNELGGADPGMFKPLFQATGSHEYYPIFSLAHLGGIIQEQLRLAPLAPIICLAVLFALWRKQSGSNPSTASQRWDAAPITILAVAAISTFLFSITWNPDLGASSDWDLLSLCGIPLGLLAGGLLAFLWPRESQNSPQPYATTLTYCGSVLLAAAAWHALSWLLANALAVPS